MARLWAIYWASDYSNGRIGHFETESAAQEFVSVWFKNSVCSIEIVKLVEPMTPFTFDSVGA